VFEMTGKSEKLDVFIDLMKPLGLVDLSRTADGGWTGKPVFLSTRF
ncbi:MAG: hypothetical protein IH908_09400, partial [Proteobacteria bacterium]|nr:hypothetical protein [Pseudomonadota bacterium]